MSCLLWSSLACEQAAGEGKKKLGEWSELSVFLPQTTFGLLRPLFFLRPVHRLGKIGPYRPRFLYLVFILVFFFLSKWNERQRDWYRHRPCCFHSNRQSSTGAASRGMATYLLTSRFHGITNRQAYVCLLNRLGLLRPCHVSHVHSLWLFQRARAVIANKSEQQFFIPTKLQLYVNRWRRDQVVRVLDF